MTWAIVLVSPKGPANVGGVARLMGNFGYEDLRIVDPRCDLEDLDCKRMSMTSYDIIRSAKIFSTFEEAISDRTYCIALSGRRAEDDRARSNLFEFVDEMADKVHAEDRVALVFGREEWGLRLEELDQCNRILEIPTTEEKPSINLTSAVAITLGLLFKHRSMEVQRKSRVEVLHPKKTDEDYFFSRIWRLLDQTKFLNPQNPHQHLEDLRSMYHRSEMSERDLRILFGILSGIESQMNLSARPPAARSPAPAPTEPV
jgi:tRNA/rRNA methyltransferase